MVHIGVGRSSSRSAPHPDRASLTGCGVPEFAVAFTDRERRRVQAREAARFAAFEHHVDLSQFTAVARVLLVGRAGVLFGRGLVSCPSTRIRRVFPAARGDDQDETQCRAVHEPDSIIQGLIDRV